MILLRTLLLATVVVVLAAAPAAAQDNRNPRWGGPNAGPADGTPLRALLDDLDKLVDRAEKQRTADPRFIGDLRQLARRYDRPSRDLLLSDDFGDGNFTANPTWTVSTGRYWIEPGHGLRSAVTIQPQQSGSQGTDQRSSGRDIAISILDEFLNRSGQQSQSQGQAYAPAEPASIHVANTISNAFAMRLELTSWAREGRLEFGPYQGTQRTSGYRLIYHPGATPGLELVSFSPRGSSVVYSHAAALAIEDRRLHVVEWMRNSSDEMTVSLDGRELIRTTDRSFRDPFDGFEMVNRSGDYTLARIRIDGMQ